MKSFISLILMCCVLPVIAVPIFTQDNNAQWTLDSNVTYVDQSPGNDVPTLRTGSISDNGSTSVALAFSDVGSIEFYIKTSSEGGWDRLIVDFGDGNTYEYSGENDYWQQLYWDWGDYGEHTVTLTYSKDGSASYGEDCCWIWFEGVDLLDMGGSDADDSQKDWEMSKTNPWYADSGLGEWNYNYENSKYVPYLNTHWIDEGQESWFSYAVEGLNAFSFRYIVSSEENSDYLIVFVDGQEVERFSGEKWYESYEILLPDKGRHIIKWMYKKDSNGNTAGNDYACVWFEGIEKIVCDGYSMNMVYPWAVDYTEWGIKTGEIPEGDTTSFSKTIIEAGEFSFRWKTSSEVDSDWFKYYVNGECKGELSGITDWNDVTVSCNAGDKITWEYSKDENGSTDGQDCGWVDFSGMEYLNNIIGAFPEEDKLTITKTIAVDMEVGRDVLRNFLDGDEGVSFASGDPLVWIYDENEGAMRSAEVARGGESWMSAAVIGKGTFSYRWKSSGETLSCYVDGELKETLSGGADWAQVDISLENDARHEIKWVFARGEDSSDAAAAGWVDGIVWNAPDGWDDPDEPIVPDTVSSFIKLDLRPSPRILEAKDVVEEIVYDPAWVNGAALAVLSIGGIEKISSAESGTHEWTPGDAGEFEMKLVFKNASGNQIGEPLTASFKVVLDPLPQLGGNATAAEVAAVINGAADGKLKENVVDYVTYTNFCAWVNGKGVDHRAAMNSLYSWLSYALDAAGLILVPPKEGDLTIDGFTPLNDGVIELEVNLKDISVGENATAANLEKVFGVEGAKKLTSVELGELGVGFSSENVEVNDAAPENGNVKFSVTPKMENGEKPDSFFFRVKMK